MYVASCPRTVAHKCRITMQYSSTAVQPVQLQYSRFAVLVQQYSQYSCTRLCQRLLYFSTAVQQYSSSTAVQQTAGAQRAVRFCGELTAAGGGGTPALAVTRYSGISFGI